MVGQRAPNWRGGKEAFDCDHCGAELEDYPSQRGQHQFCDQECRALWLSTRAPHNKGATVREAKECGYCEDVFEDIPSLIATRKYCSRECSARAQRVPDRRSPSYYHQREEYREWRLSVLARDGGACRWCEDGGRKTRVGLEVHHLIPVSVHPDLVFEVDNGITLCRPHHMRTLGSEAEHAETLASMAEIELLAGPCNNARWS